MTRAGPAVRPLTEQRGGPNETVTRPVALRVERELQIRRKEVFREWRVYGYPVESSDPLCCPHSHRARQKSLRSVVPRKHGSKKDTNVRGGVGQGDLRRRVMG